ncbi:MAG: GNAT family N-acetyltransferase [Novosphingobium sp.]
MFIRSERLFLRPGWPEDWAEMTARIGDAAIVRNLAHAPWAATGSDERDPGDPRCPQLLVTLPTSEGSEVIGCAGLAPGLEGIELGYWIARERGGQGYATEAVRALLSLARTLGHRRIVANHCRDNHASGAVLRKVGFRPTGETRLRFCIERGVEVPAEAYALEFGGPCNCDDDPASLMRAA